MQPPTTEELRRQFGAAVTRRREALGWSQRRLARVAGLGPDTVSAIERGEHGGSDLTRIALARAMQVEVHDLFVYPTVVDVAEVAS
jgi:transcriptional regulator with XRE-family HTH domain